MSKYNRGNYEEEISETYHNTIPGSFPWVEVPYADESGDGTDIFYLDDIEINGTSSEGRNISGYGMTNGTAITVFQSFVDIFPSFTTSTRNSSDPLLRYRTYRDGAAWTRRLEYSPWLQPNISYHMDRLSTAMTNVIRSAVSREMVLGESFRIETYVAVHWEWLTFPFTLWILSVVFLVLTMLKTSKEGTIGVWKTSAMPTLIYSLPKDAQNEIVSSASNDSVSRKGARKLKIRLLPDQGWRISGQVCVSPTIAREGQRHRIYV
jgi:hypothetical protein